VRLLFDEAGEIVQTVAQRPRTEAGQLRAGFHYVRVNTGLLVPLLMMALIGTFAYEFAARQPPPAGR
jgi:hypothetical protein